MGWRNAAYLGSEIILRPTSLSGGDDGNFTDLITSLNAGNGGTIKLIRGTPYSFDAAVTMLPKVGIEGEGYRVDGSFNIVDGTIIQGNGLTAGFVYNNTALAGQPATTNDVLNAKLSGLRISNIAFTNFTRALHFGDLYNTGIFESELINLLATDCTEWGFYLENCSNSDYVKLRVSELGVGAIGAMYVGASTTAYNHGNCRGAHVYVQTNRDGVRGIVFQARSGAQLNDMNIRRLQCNTSNVKYSQAATMTASSPDITVTDGTKFPLDMPVTVSATANGFTKWRTYFIVSQIGNVVQIADRMRGTALNATGSTAVNLDRYGFPGLEIVGLADNANSIVQASQFSGIDVEGLATTLILAQKADVQLDIGYSTAIQGTQCASVFTARGTGGTWRASKELSYDSDTSTLDWFCLGAAMRTGDETPLIQHPPVGWYAAKDLRLAFCLGRSGGDTTEKHLHSQAANTGAFLFPSIAMGQRTENRNSAMTLDSRQAGVAVYTGTTSVTWTLPAWVDGAGGAAATYSAGMPWFICNGSTTAGANLTFAANTGDNINRQASKTSLAIPPGGAIAGYANYDGAATFYQLCGAWHVPDTQDIAYAAAITPDCALGVVINVGVLTGNITVNNPTNLSKGMEVTLNYESDATGTRQITYGTTFKSSAVPASSASGKASQKFTYDGVHLVQTGGALVWI